MNLDNEGNPGTHWVCIVNDSKCKFVEYFDPFGIVPPKEIHAYLKTADKDIRFNDNQLQKVSSVRCGYFCCYYIEQRSKAIKPLDVLYDLTQVPSEYNEKTVLQ